MSQRVMTWEAWIGPLLLAVVGGIVATAPQNKPASRRPTSAGAPLVAQESTTPSSVFARPWEDPLLAVSLEKDEPKVSAAGGGRRRNVAEAWGHSVFSAWQRQNGFAVELQDLRALQLALQESFAPHKKRLIVLAEMTGDPGLEGEESRRTERMAITEAMMACGLKGRRPLDELGRLRVITPVRTGIGRCLAYQVMASDQAACLVVFVPDQLLGDHQSLARCVAIARLLSRAMPRDEADLPVLVRRRGSTGLIHDLTYASAHPYATGGLDIRVLNTMSTMPLRQLRVDNPLFDRWRRTAEMREAGLGAAMMPELGSWRIGRVLGPDTPLIAMIVRELDLRRAGLGNPENAIAVVYEPESPYGKAFAAVLEEQAGVDKSRVRRVTFSGGLDVPPRSEHGRNAYREFKENAEKAGASSVPVSAMTPLGPRRTDYVYRQLAAHQQELARQKKKLSAVILCAGDTMDKRPLIQLIRERFPDCLIATTDLNAMLTDTTDWRVMRNLVVASHLDLSLGDQIQGSVAPFRSAYDASLFLGIRHALHELTSDAPPTEPWHAALNRMTPGGRLYEIGRDGSVLLQAAAGVREWPPAAPGVPPASLSAMAERGRSEFVGPSIAHQPDDEVFYPVTSKAVGQWRPGAAVALARAPRTWLSSEMLVILCVGLTATLAFQSRDTAFLALVFAAVMTVIVLLYLQQAGVAAVVQPWLALGLTLAVTCGVLGRLTLDWADSRRRQARLSQVGRIWMWVCGVLAVAAIVVVSFGSAHGSNWKTAATYYYGMIGMMGLASLAAMSWHILKRQLGEPERVAEAGSPAALPEETRTEEVATDPWWALHRRGLCWVGLGIAVYLISAGLVWVGSGVEEEPWGWMDGVSAWPSELIRLGTVVLGGAFLLVCARVHARLWRCASGVDELFSQGERWAVMRGLETEIQRGSEANAAPRRGGLRWRGLSAVVWPVPLTAADDVHVETVLRGLRARCRLTNSLVRISLLGLMLACIVAGAVVVMGVPRVPVRGEYAYAIHTLLLVLSVAVLNAVVLVIWDGGHLCSRYVGLLSHGRSQWPDKFKQAAERLTGVSQKYVDSWLDVRSIGRVTRAINGLIYWPVILILLSAAAWHRGFDAWPFSWLLVVCNGLSLSLCVLAAWTLRRASESARRGEIQHLTQDLADLDHQDELDYKHCRSRDAIDFQLKFGPNYEKLYLEHLLICRDGMTPQPDRDVDQRSALAIANRISSLIDDVMESTQVRFNPNQSVDMHLNGDGGVYRREGDTLVRINNAEKRVLREILNTAATDERRIERRVKARAARAEQIKLLIEQIRDVREGAFAPWTEDPVFRGVVVPALGFISVKFADWVNVAVR